MAVIPQYKADSRGTETPRPQLERRQGQARISAGASIEALGTLAGQLIKGSVPLQGYSNNHGQAIGQGLSEVGQGVTALGNVINEIRTREAEARAIADIHEAKLALEAEQGRFAQWQEQNQSSPKLWLDEAEKRFQGFQTMYMGRDDLSPHAQSKIKEHFASTIQNQMVQVGVDTTRATFKQASEAMSADYMRAVHYKNREAVGNIAMQGFRAGYWGEDDAVRMQIRGGDDIDAAINRDLTFQADTAVLNRDMDGARAAVGALILPESEKRYRQAHFEKVIVRGETMDAINDAIAIDPREAISMIDSSLFPTDILAPRDRGGLRTKAQIAAAHDDTATLAGVLRDIREAGISLEEIDSGAWGADSYRSLPPDMQEAVKAQMAGHTTNRASSFMEMQRKVRSFSPADDSPNKMGATMLEREILLNFDGAMQEELLGHFEQVKSGEAPAISSSDKQASAAFDIISERYKNGRLGNFRTRKDQIHKLTVDGVERLAVVDPKGEYKPETGWINDFNNPWWGSRRRFRFIELSEVDALRIDSANRDDLFTDLAGEEATMLRKERIFSDAETEMKAGRITDQEGLLQFLDTRTAVDSQTGLLRSGAYGEGPATQKGSAFNLEESLRKYGH